MASQDYYRGYYDDDHEDESESAFAAGVKKAWEKLNS